MLSTLLENESPTSSPKNNNSLSAEVERSLTAAVERERISREEVSSLQERLNHADAVLHATRDDVRALSQREEEHLRTVQRLEEELAM